MMSISTRRLAQALRVAEADVIAIAEQADSITGDTWAGPVGGDLTEAGAVDVIRQIAGTGRAVDIAALHQAADERGESVGEVCDEEHHLADDEVVVWVDTTGRPDGWAECAEHVHETLRADTAGVGVIVAGRPCDTCDEAVRMSERGE